MESPQDEGSAALPVQGPDGEGDSLLLKSAISSVTSGTIITMMGTIGFLILSLAWRLLIVRLITVEQWGEMSIAFALIALITSLAPLGVQAAVARGISYEREEDQRGIVYSGMLVTAASGLAFTAAFYLLASTVAGVFRDPQLIPVIQILSPSIFLAMIIGTVSSVFQGYQNTFPYAVFVNILPNVLSIGLALFFYYLGLGFMGILYSAVLNSVLVAIILLPYSRSRLKRYLRPGPRKMKVKMLIAFGLPLVIVTSLNSLMAYADTLFLGFFRNETLVGFYSAGITLGRIVSFSVSALSFIFLPVASQLYAAKRHRDLERTYSTATKWALVTSVPLLVIFTLYPGQSLALTFGEPYRVASTVLEIRAIGIFITSLFGPEGAALVAFGRTRLLAMNSTISVSANIVASLTLIPAYGMDGGAIASVIGAITFSSLSLVQVAYYYKLHPFNRMYIKSLIASLAGSFIILIPLGLNPSLLDLPFIFLGLALFSAVCILVTKSVDRTDVLLLEVAEGIIGRRLSRMRRLGTMLVGRTR